MIKKLLLVLAVVLLAVVIAMVYFMWKGPDLSRYDHLIEPAISTKPPQKMILVEVEGDPNVVAEGAYELLYELYYGTAGVDLWPLPAPRARWTVSPDRPKEEWIGIYGIPVPDSVSELPEHTAVPGMEISLATWTYGEVVELLYIGPYDDETPSIQTMRDYVDARGYAFTGPHEEEYLKGPGMIFSGNPDEYVTILRYEVGPRVEPVTDGPDTESDAETVVEPQQDNSVDEP